MKVQHFYPLASGNPAIQFNSFIFTGIGSAWPNYCKQTPLPDTQQIKYNWKKHITFPARLSLKEKAY